MEVSKGSGQEIVFFFLGIQQVCVCYVIMFHNKTKTYVIVRCSLKYSEFRAEVW